LSPLFASTPLTWALLAIGVVAAFLLLKWRDRLFTRLGVNTPARETIAIAPGIRIMVVEIGGKRLACALNRDGVSAMEVLGDVSQEQRN